MIKSSPLMLTDYISMELDQTLGEESNKITKMTGFGSPCGACKFLRRKCARGCIFAPYFCHEQGAAHFAAIHKVFGASNVSKLLTHLPVTDRCEAAVTISYEAQARVQDPIYGCVAHIFALQQQVVNLQAQLASLKAQVPQEEKLYKKSAPFQQELHGFSQVGFDAGGVRASDLNFGNGDERMWCNNGIMDSNYIQSSQVYSPSFNVGNNNIFSTDEESLCSMRQQYHDMEDLQSVAFAHLHRA